MALITAAICVAGALIGVLLASRSSDGAAARLPANGWAGAVRPPGSGAAPVQAHRPGRQDGHRGVAARPAGRLRVHLLHLPGHLPGAGADDPRRARRATGTTCRSYGVSVDPANDTPQLRAGVPAQAEDDGPDAVPARRRARSSQRPVERVRHRAAGEGQASTRPTPCSSTARAASASASRSTSSRRPGSPTTSPGSSAWRERPRRAGVLRRLAALPAAALAAFERDRAAGARARTSSRRPARARRCSASS